MRGWLRPFLSRARPSVLSNGLPTCDTVNSGTAAAYLSYEPHFSATMPNTRFFDQITRGGTEIATRDKSERIPCRGERARPLQKRNAHVMMYTKTRESDQLSLFRLMLNLGYVHTLSSVFTSVCQVRGLGSKVQLMQHMAPQLDGPSSLPSHGHEKKTKFIRLASTKRHFDLGLPVRYHLDLL